MFQSHRAARTTFLFALLVAILFGGGLVAVASVDDGSDDATSSVSDTTDTEETADDTSPADSTLDPATEPAADSADVGASETPDRGPTLTVTAPDDVVPGDSFDVAVTAH